MNTLLRTTVSFGVIAGAAIVGCSAEGNATQGDDQNITADACDVVSEITKKKMSAEELAKNQDPIAQKILLNGSCPSNLNAIMEKLSTTDNANCTGGNEGLSTRLVNDAAFLTGEAEGLYRGVVTKDCDGRARPDFFLSVFGVTPQSIPQDGTELIGFDKTSGVYNFYLQEKSQWKFMGSSKDGISAGYECNEFGSCFPKAAKEARCWACHEGGGINMKELQSPWDSWNVNTPMPGSDEIFAKHGKILGRSETGFELESRVREANGRWNKTRLQILKEKGAAEVLRPLFCTLTINLEQGGSADFFASDILMTKPFSFLGNLQGKGEDYLAFLKSSGQRLQVKGQPLVGKNGPVTDTQTPNRFIMKGDIDLAYISDLKSAGIVDRDFVEDVSIIDFTRPVFSKTRCDLLSAAPALSGADLTAQKIRDGFMANLAGKTGAAAELLKHLQDRNDADAHQATVSSFFRACEARPQKEFLSDLLTYVSITRNQARAHRSPSIKMGIIEQPELQLPVDNLPASNKAFDPVTCTLK